MQAADLEKLRAENLFKSLQERVESFVNLPWMVARLYEELSQLIRKAPPQSVNSTNEIFAAVHHLLKWTDEEIMCRCAVLAQLKNNMLQLNKYCNDMQAFTSAATVAVDKLKVVINNLLKEQQLQLDTRLEDITGFVELQTGPIEVWMEGWIDDVTAIHQLAVKSEYGMSVQWRECAIM
jgi:hypothetical protein